MKGTGYLEKNGNFIKSQSTDRIQEAGLNCKEGTFRVQANSVGVSEFTIADGVFQEYRSGKVQDDREI